MDADSSIAAERFYRMLARVMPRVELPPSRRTMPWDTMAWDASVHLGLFVHRVDGIEPGLYLPPVKRAAIICDMDADAAHQAGREPGLIAGIPCLHKGQSCG